jgi:hypothetical protein
MPVNILGKTGGTGPNFGKIWYRGWRIAPLRCQTAATSPNPRLSREDAIFYGPCS